MEASFKFAAEARGNPSFRSDFVYWSTEGNNDTMLSIENVSNEDVAVRVTIGFNDGAGTYRFVPVIIPRKATVGLDLKQLIAQAAQPDDKGNKIPAEATFGSLRVETADEQLNERIMVTVSIYDPVAGTCGGGCVICNGINSYDLTANPFIGAISTSQQVTATVWWDDGSNTDATLNTTFTSSNTSAISVTSTPGTSGNGMATFNAVGTSVISGRFFVTGEPVGEPPPICPASCPRTILTGPTPGTATPRIDSISPPQGLIGNTISVTIAGKSFGTSPIVNTVQGIIANIQTASDTQITVNFVISSTSLVTGNSNVTVTNVAANLRSNGVNFYIQVPTKLIRTDYPGIPNGYGPLVVLTGGSNGNVVNAGGQVLKTNQCGMYRNLVYSLQDQRSPAQDIDGTYTLVEMFSNYSTTIPGGTVPPTQSFNMTPGGLLNDIQFIGTTAPTCPGSDQHEAFTQSHQVTIGTGTFPLTTVNSIQRGTYSGTAHVDVTITTP
ncbi:MAG: hypothetical protein WCA40_16765 [Candidatus Acidiferrum sp.]